MLKNRFANQLGTEFEFSRDKNHGLYSLASRLDVPFKNVYPDSLRYDVFKSCEFARLVRCSKEKMLCKCTYLTHNLFALRNKKTKREAYGCYFCVKDLVDSLTRCEIHRYVILYRHRKWDASQSKNVNLKWPSDDIHGYLQDKEKNMVECAHYFRVITDDDRAILFDDKCDTRQKHALKKTIQMFFILGNGYNSTDLGQSLIINDNKNNDVDN